MKTLERNFGTKVGYMHEQVCGTGADGPPSPFTLVHTASRHMSADIYTKGFTDRVLFSSLKQMINVYSQEQWRTLALSPKPNTEDEESVLPEGKDWVNLQYHFIMRGDNTEKTDFRKPIKPKTPKAKSKVMKRPTTRRVSSDTASSEMI